MIRINLIKKRYVIPVHRKERFFLFVAIFLPVLLFSFVILGFVYSVNNTVIRNYSSRVKKQNEALMEEQKKLLSPTSEEKVWREEWAGLTAFQDQHLLLAPKLVVLSDAISNRFYLNKIAFEANTLSLEGQGLPGNQTMVSLAVFLEKLNGNENFMRDLKELKIEGIQAEAGILNFRIAGTKK